MLSRAEHNAFGEWWWTIDRWLILGFALLMLCGILFGMAATPAVAEKLNRPTFDFVHKQLVFLVPSILIMLAISCMNMRHVRRSALVLFLIGFALILATLIFGAEVKGARRWISIAGVNLQPTEFIKPAFVVLVAWAFSEKARGSNMPGTLVGLLLLPLVIVPLILQPDFGQSLLLSTVWAGLFFMSGLHALWVLGLGGAATLGFLLAYRFLPHVTARFDKFLNKGTGGDNFQVETAIEAFTSGGWFGKGPGEGSVKRILPDAHTDFMFAVVGEEFGAIIILLVVSLFALIVLRGLSHAWQKEDPFARFTITGLIMLFGLQSIINMSVNLSLIPPKGMTLPFLSYGGSSLLSVSITAGFLLATTRKRPQARFTESVGFQRSVERAAENTQKSPHEAYA